MGRGNKSRSGLLSGACCERRIRQWVPASTWTSAGAFVLSWGFRQDCVAVKGDVLRAQQVNISPCTCIVYRTCTV